ncbi:MAG: hypothetical protein IJT13_01270 [Bacteroidaceae bacterium]|nr:hypothetical protein [Bacteroidaceae bacterium]
MNPLKRTWIWLCRFRNRRGYGIHSPFAFNLVKGVIYERAPFYAYKPLHKLREQRDCTTNEHDDKLLFRLINDHQPETALLLCPSNDIGADYLKAGCRKCHFYTENDAKRPDNFQLIYIYKECPTVEKLLSLTNDRTLVIIRNIRQDKETLAWWKQLQQSEKIRVTMDLYEIGLAYTESRLNKQDYIINY